MKSDMNDLKKLVFDLIRHGDAGVGFQETNSRVIRNLFNDAPVDKNLAAEETEEGSENISGFQTVLHGRDDIQDTEEVVEESLSLAGKEIEMIRKALEKHNGKRKLAARELGISERTLYRKIKEYDIEN